MGKYFGTDGIRGIAGKKLSLDLAVRCGRALGALCPSEGKIVIGKDTRMSGDMLENALAAGIMDMGIDCVLMGIAPTPAVAHAVVSGGFCFGVVVSASHNPPDFNGIKVFGGDGFKTSDSVEESIEKLMDAECLRCEKKAPENGLAFGQLLEGKSLLDGYINSLKKMRFNSLENKKICLDCGEGASCVTAQNLFRHFGWDTLMVASSGQGSRINDMSGALHPKNAANAVKNNGCFMGFSFDGDADRVVAVNERGDCLDGDAILYLAALKMKRDGMLKKDTVVGTVMTNSGVEHALNQQGISLIRTAVGDKYVIEKMNECGYILGGESSGHIILGSYSTSGDGVLAALLAASVAADYGGLDEALKGLSYYPQVQINLAITDTMRLRLASDEYIDLMSGLKTNCADLRLVVRPSGTEPLLRIMAECPLETTAKSACNRIEKFLLS